jgi:O-antigen/teichoic acid export membrane protein
MRMERIARGALSNYAGRLVMLAVGVFMTPFMLSRLGPTSYGLWVLVGSLVAYGMVLDLGITNAIVKWVAEFRVTHDLEQAPRLVATAMWVYSALGLLVVVMSAVLAPMFPLLFQVPPDEHTTATWLAFLAGATVGISLPCSVSLAILRGLQRFDFINALNVANALISSAGMVVVLLLGGGVIGVVLVGLTVMLVLQVPSIWLIRRVAPELRLGWRGATPRLARPVFGYSSSVFVVSVAGRLQTRTDEMVIGAFLPVANVTPYALASKLGELPQVLASQFLNVLLPHAAELHAKRETSQLRDLYLTSTRVTLAIVAPVGGILAYLAGPILTVWVGPMYADAAPLVWILVAATAVDSVLWPAGSVMQALSRHRPLALMAIGSGVANLTLSILLVQRVGPFGVALGTLVPASVEALVFVLPFSARVLNITVRQVAREVILPGLAPLLPMYSVLAILVGFGLVEPSGLVAIACLATVALFVYAATYLSLGPGAAERHVLWSLVRSPVARH